MTKESQIISFEPAGGDQYNVVYTAELATINPKMQTEQIEKIFAKEPYNFEAAFELSRRYLAEDKYEKACETRFRAATQAIEALPEDEEYFELAWEDEENQEFIEIIVASGTDFYVHGDFEMSAALFETALSLDPEDHLDVAPQLALSYIAIEDWDGYEMLKNDFSPGSMNEALVENFAAFCEKRKPSIAMQKELVQEITSTDHEVGEEFFAEADKDRVSKEVAARELWYRHMAIFETYPEFVNLFKK